MNAHRDIDELYIYAQLIAADTTEAAQLAEAAVRLRSGGNSDPADVLIRSLTKRKSEAEDQTSRPDIFTDDRLLDELGHVIPRVFSRLSGQRRIAVRKAFLTDSQDESERSVFLILVKRALELQISQERAASVSEHDVSSALDSYLERVLSPTPSALKSVLESRLSGSGDRTAATRGKKSKAKTSVLTRLAGALLLILVTSAVATWIVFPKNDVSNNANSQLFDIISLHAPSQDLAFQGSESSQIERFILDRLDRRVAVPQLLDGSIVGISVETISQGLQLPAVRYSDLKNSEDVVLFILDYDIVTQMESQMSVDRDVLNQIAADGSVDIRLDGGNNRLIFRSRDDIYLIKTESDVSNLRERIQFN